MITLQQVKKNVFIERIYCYLSSLELFTSELSLVTSIVLTL